LRAENLGLYYVVLEIKGRLIPALEKFPDVEWISEQIEYHAVSLEEEEGVPGSQAAIFPLIHVVHAIVPLKYSNMLISLECW